MKELSIERMEEISGSLNLWNVAGPVCAVALSGAMFGGFGLFVTGAMFGPSCLGLVAAAAINN